MPSVELIGIILTGTISAVDLLVNAVALCMSGNCQVECCGNKLSHVDTEGQLTEQIRRMSGAPPPPLRTDPDISEHTHA